MKLCFMSVLSANDVADWKFFWFPRVLVHATIPPPVESILGWSVGRIPRLGTTTSACLHCTTRTYTSDNVIPIIMITSENFQNKSDVPDMNQRPTGLQPVALPLS